MILDCTSFDSTLTSLESLLQLSHQTLLDIITSFDCAQYAKDHPNDDRKLKEILLDLFIKHGGNPQIPVYTCWFHGTRVLTPDSLLAGIRPLNEQIDRLWQDLFGLARNWITESEWNDFNQTIETSDLNASSEQYRHRLNFPADWGPHAVLIRDCLLDSGRFGSVNYLHTPETVEDISLSFKRHFSHDLQTAFHNNSRPCIVKFRDRRPNPDVIGVAATYLWCRTQGETCIRCNTCYEGNRKSIAKTEILNLEVF